MAIKAVISIVDDESGRTYLKNHLLDPSCVSEFPGLVEHTRYDFDFRFNIVNEELLPKPTVLKGDYNCMACAHDGDSNICSECENGSKFLKWR